MQLYIGKYYFNIFSAYLASIIFLSPIYSKSPDTCLFTNSLATVIIFLILCIGVINFSKDFFNYSLIIIGFPVILYHFFKNPGAFIRTYGIDENVITKID